MKKYENFILSSLLVIHILLYYPLQAAADDVPSYTAEQLTELAKAWLAETLALQHADTELTVTPLDARISDRQCAAIQFSLPANYNLRQTTLQINCSEPVAWQLFLPVRVTEWLELVTIKQNISPGTIITADMLEVQRRERRLVRGNIVLDPTVIIGSRNKRSLSVGQIISLQDLCLVCRGDVVTIQISKHTLSVSASGVAQQDGSLGDAVTVRNQQSGRIIQTEVVGVNQVKVKF